MNLSNRILTLHGKQCYILAGKPTENPNVSIYLLRTMDEKKERSLWNVKTLEDGVKVALSPYEGEDSEELITELQQYFINNAFNEAEGSKP